MAKFKAKQEGFIKRFAKAYAYGFHRTQNKLWKCCQFQTTPAYKPTKNTKVREFGNYFEALKFAREMEKEGYHTKVQNEIAEFSGMVCEKPQSIVVVYYSKKNLHLVANPHNIGKSYQFSKTPVCTPKGRFPKDLPVKERFWGSQ